MNRFFSEYHEAQHRFQSLTNTEPWSDPLAEENECLDDIIRKLSEESDVEVTEHDSEVFFEILFRADYIQIKKELIDKFYSQLCLAFLKKFVFYDIMKNLSRLEVVPQVKFCLAKALIDICPVGSMEIRNDLYFGISNQKGIKFKLNIENISITNNVMRYDDFHRTKLTIFCLTFLLRLLNFKGLKLNGLDLNEYNTMLLSKELRIESLSLVNCGTYVNTFIQRHNTGGILSHLKELDISNIDIETTTLEQIRLLPLKILNLSRSIKNSRLHLNSETEQYYSEPNNNETQTNIDVLWEKGVLRDTIQVLDVSYNDLTETNLQRILNSQVRELDISNCLTFHNVKLSSIVLPHTLKALRSFFNKTNLEDFHNIRKSSIEIIEIDLCGIENIEQELKFFTWRKEFKSFKVFDGIIYRYSKPYIPIF